MNDEIRNPFPAHAVSSMDGARGAEVLSLPRADSTWAVNVVRSYLRGYPRSPHEGGVPDDEGRVLVVAGVPGAGKTHTLIRCLTEPQVSEDGDLRLYVRSDSPDAFAWYRSVVNAISEDALAHLARAAFVGWAVTADPVLSRQTTSLAPLADQVAYEHAFQDGTLSWSAAVTAQELTFRRIQGEKEVDRFERVARGLVSESLSPLAQRWIRAEELDPADLRSLGVRANLSTRQHLQVALRVLMAMARSARRPLLLAIDQVEAFLGVPDTQVHEENRGMLRVLQDSAREEGALFVAAMSETCYFALAPDVRDRFGSRALLRPLDSDEARELLELFTTRVVLPGGRRSSEIAITGTALELLVAGADGNPRKLLEASHHAFEAALAHTTSSSGRVTIDDDAAVEGFRQPALPDAAQFAERLTTALAAAGAVVSTVEGVGFGDRTTTFTVEGRRSTTIVIVSGILTETGATALARGTGPGRLHDIVVIGRADTDAVDLISAAGAGFFLVDGPEAVRRTVRELVDVICFGRSRDVPGDDRTMSDEVVSQLAALNARHDDLRRREQLGAAQQEWLARRPDLLAEARAAVGDREAREVRALVGAQLAFVTRCTLVGAVLVVGLLIPWLLTGTGTPGLGPIERVAFLSTPLLLAATLLTSLTSRRTTPGQVRTTADLVEMYGSARGLLRSGVGPVRRWKRAADAVGPDLASMLKREPLRIVARRIAINRNPVNWGDLGNCLRAGVPLTVVLALARNAGRPDETAQLLSDNPAPLRALLVVVGNEPGGLRFADEFLKWCFRHSYDLLRLRADDLRRIAAPGFATSAALLAKAFVTGRDEDMVVALRDITTLELAEVESVLTPLTDDGLAGQYWLAEQPKFLDLYMFVVRSRMLLDAGYGFGE